MRRTILAAAGLLALVGLGATSPAQAAPTAPTARGAAVGASRATAYDQSTHAPRPAHVAAPYVDVTEVGSLADLSAASGSRYLTLAFLQTEAPGSCTVYWAGDTSKPIAWSSYGQDIARIRKAGGDVIPSFGGFTADTTNTEIADSCTDVHKIALAYEDVVRTYGVQRLDFDIEVDSLNSNPAGVTRRNQALAELMRWADRTHRPLSVTYTRPSTPPGLGATGLALLQSAATEHAPVGGVNIMTFDYWDGADHDMLADAESAATGLVGQLQDTIAPGVRRSELWGRVGIIQMNGIDDYGPNETFTVAQARPLIRWASRHGLQTMSFWALQRDNGGCPGVVGSNRCSGLDQHPWAFSRIFAGFTSRDA